MIRFRLGCPNGHEFESWFRAGADYDSQRQKGLLACPVCGSTGIEKLPMAPAVVSSKRRAATSRASGPAEAVSGDTAAAAGGPAPFGSAELVERLRTFKQSVLSTTEDVGGRFADEARRIHYGDAPERNIRGETTAKEAAELLDEGIPFGVLPTLPEDQN